MASGSSGGGLGSRLAQLTKKYGKVALGVHISVSLLSTASLYFAISHNVDVNRLLERVGLQSKDVDHQAADLQVEMDKLGIPGGPRVNHTDPIETGKEQTLQTRADGGGKTSVEEKKKGFLDGYSGTAMQGGSALALAILANKALFPIRVPITLALTPYVSRIISRRVSQVAASSSRTKDSR